MKIVISSGHGKQVRGASGYIDEVDEARRVVNETARLLNVMGVGTTMYHDDVSTSQNENLNRIVDFHNSKTRDLDISIHFNAYQTTTKAMGTECLYVTQQTLAGKVAGAIASLGFINRGAKLRSDLFFLNNTEEPAILVEVCFVDSKADADLYKTQFNAVCRSLAIAVSGQAAKPDKPPKPAEPLPPAFNARQIDAITKVARDSSVASYSWKDRGKAPIGYIEGMALAYGMAVKRHEAGDPAAIEMAKADTHNNDVDALSWYNAKFSELGMVNSRPGLTTLRHLYVLLLGLGMRESSGKHCEGKDQSAENVESETCEAGLHQTSWNIHTCHEQIDRLFAQYAPALEDNLSQCYLEVFENGVDCSDASWKCYGSGDGYNHQILSKGCPTYHIEVTAIGLRNRRQHWGPINERKAEILDEADVMFRHVQAIVTSIA